MARGESTSWWSAYFNADNLNIATEKSERLRSRLAVAMLLAGLVLGGGGTANPGTEVILQLFGCLALLAWFLLPGKVPVPDSRLIGVAVLALALPLVQLVPLPPQLWHALPGREVEREALALVGAADAWMPWSMAPAQTMAVALAMVPAIGSMMMVASLGDGARNDVLRAIVAIGVVSVLIGTLQLAAPESQTPSFYDYIHHGWIIGFQASRNAEVDILLIAFLACSTHYALVSERPNKGHRSLVHGSIAVLLLVGAIFTGSRGGIILIPVTVLFSLIIVKHAAFGGRRTLIVSVALLLIVIVSALLLRDNVALNRVAARFAADGDFRSELWTDTVFAIKQYWPAGGGMGSFVTLMTPVERLEVVDPTLPSRAHNDYLELLLEAGLVGVIVVGIVLVLLVSLARRSWQAGPRQRVQVQFALAAIFIIAVHSLVDYPMRSMSLAMLAAIAASFLSIPANASGIRNSAP